MHSLHVSSWHLPNLGMWWFSPQYPVSMPVTVFSSNFVRVGAFQSFSPSNQGNAWIVSSQARDQNDQHITDHHWSLTTYHWSLNWNPWSLLLIRRWTVCKLNYDEFSQRWIASLKLVAVNSLRFWIIKPKNHFTNFFLPFHRKFSWPNTV
jgi:hypothetical protein